MADVWDPVAFYIFIAHGFGNMGKPAALRATAVAFAATGCDLDWDGDGHASALYIAKNVLHQQGLRDHGPYSASMTGTIARRMTFNGGDYRWCSAAWTDPSQVGTASLPNLQKGSGAASVLPQIVKAVKENGKLVGMAGLGAANDGWHTFEDFVSGWSRNKYSSIGSAAASIRRVKR